MSLRKLQLWNYYVSSACILVALLSISQSQADTYNLVADGTKSAPYPLQKTQFGVSYVPASQNDWHNVYELLKTRNSRNNDKRLQTTWEKWDASGEPVYTRNNNVSGLMEQAAKYGAIGGANLQGPYEHPDFLKYRLSSQRENRWNWTSYSRHSMLYYLHLKQQLQTIGMGSYPFVFGIGHEANNDAGIDTYGMSDGCVDGVAFAGDLDAFYDLVITQNNDVEGDRIQADTFWVWYKKTLDNLCQQLGNRDRFLIAAGQPHTSNAVGPGWYTRFHELVNRSSVRYLPYFIGCHSRRNPDDVSDFFFSKVVYPSRTIFNDRPGWNRVPVMCNEFGSADDGSAGATGYEGTMRGALRLLTIFEHMLRSPDIAYANIAYNTHLVSSGTSFYPAFHAFRFYQNMPQRRIPCTGDITPEIHVLPSAAPKSRMAALLFRDGLGAATTHTVNFTFSIQDTCWTRAKAYLYLISNADKTQVMTSGKSDANNGMDAYLASGYPKTVEGVSNLATYTFSNISMPQASIAMLLLERIDNAGNPVGDSLLDNKGPGDAQYIKTWQWCARNDAGGVDSSWGYFDTRNWTLFAGISDLGGPSGSAEAAYGSSPRVQRGMAGVEFSCKVPSLCLEINLEGDDLQGTTRNPNAIGAIRIDFYNGTSHSYDAAVVYGSSCLPDRNQYASDYVPWGYGDTNETIVPQKMVPGTISDGRAWNVNLDEEYRRLSGHATATDFTAGGRRIIVSNWVENVRGGIVTRISTGKDATGSIPAGDAYSQTKSQRPAVVQLNGTGCAQIQISYTLANPQRVTLSLYDLRGSLINKYLDKTMNMGSHTHVFDIATNSDQIAHGIYVVYLTMGNHRYPYVLPQFSGK